MMKPLTTVVALCLLLAVHAHPENIEDVKELPQTKEPVVEAEESDTQTRVERCSACAPKLNLNIKSPKEIIEALQSLPGGEVHTQQTFEGCSSSKGCAGIKLQDGKVTDKFGNVQAFGGENAFQAGAAFGGKVLNGKIPDGGPFWWMNADSPFKAAFNSGRFEKKTASSSYTAGTGADLTGALDISKNVFLNPGVNSFAGKGQSSFESSSFQSTKEGAIDISNNPFLAGAGFSGAEGQGSYSGVQSGTRYGAASQSTYDGNTGYVGSSPSPFATSTGSSVNLIPNAQKTNEYDYDQTQQSFNDIFQAGEACTGQGYFCVLKSQCLNGVVTNAAAAKTKKPYCSIRTESCCRFETTAFGVGFTSGAGSQGVGIVSGQGSAGAGSFSSAFDSQSGYGSQSSIAGASGANGFGSTDSYGSTLRPGVSRPTGQNNFIETDSFTSQSENSNVYRPGAVGSGLKPGIPYLPPVDNNNSGTNVVSSTVYPSTFVTSPRPFSTPRPYTPIQTVTSPRPISTPVSSIRPFSTQRPYTTPRPVSPIRPFTTASPTYLPPVPSTSAPGYLPPIGEQTINRETFVPKPTYSEGELILDDSRFPTTPRRPTVPVLTDIPAGCAAALKCTPVEFCTADGIISNTTVVLSRDQDAYRVPLTDCKDLETGRIGKCCRDPFYTDPWPTNQLGKWVSGVFGGNDGKYVPDSKVSSNNPRPQVTARPYITGSTILNNFRPPKPTVPTVGPSQVTPVYPGQGVQSTPSTNQVTQYGQGQYSKGGVGQYGLGGVGQVTQTGVGQYAQKGIGQVGQVGVGQYAQKGIGQIGIGQFGQKGVGQISQTGVGQFGQKGVGQIGQVGVGQFGQVEHSGVGEFGQVGVGQIGQTGIGKFGEAGVGQFGQAGVGQYEQTGFGQIGQSGIGQKGQTGFGQFGQAGLGQTSQVGIGQVGIGQLGQTGVGKIGQTGVGQVSQSGVGQISQTGIGKFGQTGVGQIGQFGVGQYSQTGLGQIGQAGVGQIGVTGTGQYTQNGGGQIVQSGAGQYSKGSTGTITQEGVGQYAQKGEGQYSQVGIGQYTQNGVGQYTQTGIGQYTKVGRGQIIGQGQGQIGVQGAGIGVTQLEGAQISQGQGQLTTQGLGFGQTNKYGLGFSQGIKQVVENGQGQYTEQGVGQTIVQGGGVGYRQGVGLAVSQGVGSTVENEYSASTRRIYLQRYNGAGQCGIKRPQKPYGNHEELEVDFAEIPWQAMVLLQTNKSLLCGGVIARPDVVITSAACVDGLDAKNVLVKGGEWKLGIDDEPLPFQIVQVKTIVFHPGYKPGFLQDDVAILHLAENLRFANNIQPVCMPDAKDTLDAFYEGAGECIVTGWGKQVLQAHLKGSIMHSVNVSLIAPTECESKIQQDYPHLLEYYDQESCVCGQPTNPLNNICRVDIGSALACTTGDGYFVLKGIYSWDSGCQTGNQLAAFYKFDIEWYEWAIGITESVRFTQYGRGTKITQTRYTGVKGSQFASGVKGSLSGVKQFGVSGQGQYTQFGIGQVGVGQEKISSGLGQISTGQGQLGSQGFFGLGQGQISTANFTQFSTSGKQQFSTGSGSLGQFATGKFGAAGQGSTDYTSGSLNLDTSISSPISNTFSATYTEKKFFQTEPKIVTYTTKPEIVTYTTKPEIVTFTTKPEIFTYTTKPKIITYTTKPKIITYTTKPKIITYTTKPKIITYTTKPQFITYETSGSGTNPQYVAPGVTFNPSFAEIVGKQHQHNAQCKCLDNAKK